MKALVYRGPEHIEHTEVADPQLTDDLAAVVEVHLAGLCGSDLHIFHGQGFSRDVDYCVGHEAVGVVREVGAGVHGFRVGDRVLVPASVGCGSCWTCRQGDVLGCERSLAGCYGLGHALPGSQAEAVAVPRADFNLVALSDTISDEDAVVLADNAPTGWFGARLAEVGPGDDVLVVGLGPVGLLAAAAARVMGARRVLGLDLVAERRDRAAGLGIHVIDDAAGARGVDASIDAVGTAGTIDGCIDATRIGGCISVIGVNRDRRLELRFRELQARSQRLTGGLCSVQRELPALLRLVEAGALRPADVVTHRLPLAAGPDAYRMVAERHAGVGKVVLDPRS